ncbi:MAG: fimbrillin family protein, partial [Muribaculaceae bacterium]
MKKNFLFAFAALIAVSSCTSEINEEGFVDKANSISFNAYSNKSRAVTGDVTSDNMKNDNFGVVGYTNDDKNIYLYTGSYAAVEQTWDGDSWEYKNTSELKFWPKDNMDFYAYFPFSDNATFATTNNSSEAVMTISTTCAHDVLFAYNGNVSKTDRVPLNFYHAFAKMMTLTISMPAEGTLYKSGCQIEVKGVEFINTSTSGNIKVDNAG